MDDLFWLTTARVARLAPFFPKSRGRARVDDRRVLSGIVFVNRNGLRWRDAPAAYGPPKTLDNRWVLEPHGHLRPDAADAGRGRPGHQHGDGRRDPPQDAPHGGVAARAKGGSSRLIGRTRGGLNSKLHAVVDARGRPLRLFLTAGQTSDHVGARALLSSIPPAEALLADRGYEADWFRHALTERDITPCIPSRKGRKAAIPHDALLYRQRHRIENTFGRLKDRRRIATRCDRCADRFLSACAFAAVILFWL